MGKTVLALMALGAFANRREGVPRSPDLEAAMASHAGWHAALRAGLATAGAMAALGLLSPAMAQNPMAPTSQQQREGATNPEGAPVRITVDKSQYNLFSPTPADQMRPFATDRPGKTHSTLTADAGHFQLESDVWNYTWDRFTRDPATVRAYSVANPYLKLGVTNWADVEVQIPTYNSLAVRSRDGRGSLRARGEPPRVSWGLFGVSPTRRLA